MAAMYNEILSGRYNRILQKLLSMKGGAPAPQLSGDLSAGITLEEDRPEWAYLAGDFLAAAPAVKAADAANLSAIGITLAANSGVLAWLEGFLVNNENAALTTFNLGWGGPAMGTLFRAYPRDIRWLTPSTKRSACQVGSAVEAATSLLLMDRVTLPAGGSIYIPASRILTPATSGTNQFAIETDLVNKICSVTFYWRERALEESELAR